MSSFPKMAHLGPNTSSLWQSYEIGYPEPNPFSQGSADADDQQALPTESSHTLYLSQGTTEASLRRPSVDLVTHKRIIICCDGTWQSSVTGRENIPSNVTRLARSIAPTGNPDNYERNIRQVVFYSSGVGTTGGVNIMENLRQAMFGDGLVAEVIKAYNFIVMNYAPGDQIYCFGFSRGAYTARSVAGLINDIGIIRPQEMDDFPALYDLYRNHTNHDKSFNFRQSKAYRQWITGIRREGSEGMSNSGTKADLWIQMPHTLPPESSRIVEVVGVFDTVGALGIPGLVHVQKAINFVAQRVPLLGIDYQGFHNTSMSRYIKHAFHALALDEHIKPFTPTLWRLPRDNEQCPKCHGESVADLEEKFRRIIGVGSTATEDELEDAWNRLIETQMANQLKGHKPVLRQVWFPGGHVNVGGGNPAILMGFPFDFEQIALISFTWMCDQIKTFIQLDNEEGTYEDDPTVALSTLADREIDAREKLIHRATQQKNFGSVWPLQPVWRALDRFKIYIATSTIDFYEEDKLWATGPIIDIFDILKAFLVLRVFVFFLNLIPFLSSYRTPGQYNVNKDDNTPSGVSQTNEEIHPSVYYRRVHCVDYSPESLKGFSRSKKKVVQKDGKTTHLYQWTKERVVIPEYMIKTEDYISRSLLQQSSAKGFMTPLLENGKSEKLLLHC